MSASMAAAIFVGAVLGVAVGCCGLALIGLVCVRRMDAVGRSETARRSGRRDACRHGRCECSRPAEPDRDAIRRVFEETGWIDINTVRRLSR